MISPGTGNVLDILLDNDDSYWGRQIKDLFAVGDYESYPTSNNQEGTEIAELVQEAGDLIFANLLDLIRLMAIVMILRLCCRPGRI